MSADQPSREKFTSSLRGVELAVASGQVDSGRLAMMIGLDLLTGMNIIGRIVGILAFKEMEGSLDPARLRATLEEYQAYIDEQNAGLAIAREALNAVPGISETRP